MNWTRSPTHGAHSPHGQSAIWPRAVNRDQPVRLAPSWGARTTTCPCTRLLLARPAQRPMFGRRPTCFAQQGESGNGGLLLHTDCGLAAPVGEAVLSMASAERLHRARASETASPVRGAVSLPRLQPVAQLFPMPSSWKCQTTTIGESSMAAADASGYQCSRSQVMWVGSGFGALSASRE